MRNLVLVLGLTVALAGCAQKDVLEIPTGSDVSVQKHDGVNVTGRLVEVKPEQSVVETRDGTKIQVPRSEIATLRAITTEPAKSQAPAGAVAPPTIACAVSRLPKPGVHNVIATAAMAPKRKRKMRRCLGTLGSSPAWVAQLGL